MMDFIMAFASEILFSIVTGVLALLQLRIKRQRDNERARHEENIAVLEGQMTDIQNKHELRMQEMRNEYEREMQEMRNEAKLAQDASEQNKALIGVIQATIEKNSESNNRIADSVTALAEVQRKSDETTQELKNTLETMGMQLGHTNTVIHRLESNQASTLSSMNDIAEANRSDVQTILADTTRHKQWIKDELETIRGELKRALTDFTDLAGSRTLDQKGFVKVVKKTIDEAVRRVEEKLDSLLPPPDPPPKVTALRKPKPDTEDEPKDDSDNENEEKLA